MSQTTVTLKTFSAKSEEIINKANQIFRDVINAALAPVLARLQQELVILEEELSQFKQDLEDLENFVVDEEGKTPEEIEEEKENLEQSIENKKIDIENKEQEIIDKKKEIVGCKTLITAIIYRREEQAHIKEFVVPQVEKFRTAKTELISAGETVLEDINIVLSNAGIDPITFKIDIPGLGYNSQAQSYFLDLELEFEESVAPVEEKIEQAKSSAMSVVGGFLEMLKKKPDKLNKEAEDYSNKLDYSKVKQRMKEREENDREAAFSK